MPRTIEPAGDLGRVEADQPPNLQVGHPTFGDEPTDVADVADAHTDPGCRRTHLLVSLASHLRENPLVLTRVYRSLVAETATPSTRVFLVGLARFELATS